VCALSSSGLSFHGFTFFGVGRRFQFRAEQRQRRPLNNYNPSLAQSRMALRPAVERPVTAARLLFDRQIVDARQAPTHQAVFIGFPVFVAVGVNRISGVIVAFLRNSLPQPDCRRKSKAPWRVFRG
jgi:hypothetical protein